MNYVLKLVRNVLLLKWVKQEQINLNIPTMIIVLNWFFRFIKAITGYGVVRRAFYFCRFLETVNEMVSNFEL